MTREPNPVDEFTDESWGVLSPSPNRQGYQLMRMFTAPTGELVPEGELFYSRWVNQWRSASERPVVMFFCSAAFKPSLDDRLASAVRTAHDAVESRIGVLGGRPVIAGTRFPLAQVFAELADGESIDSLVENFELDRSKIKAILLAVSIRLERPWF